MNDRRSVLAFALAFALALAASFAAGAPIQSRNHFDADAMLREPAFFDFMVLGAPGEAHWKVVTEFNPPSAPNAVSQVLTERPADSIGAAIRRNIQFSDGTLSVGIKKLSGRAGVVFRVVDDKNYMALLIDPIAGDARLVRSEKGRTRELARGKFVFGEEQWGFLSVAFKGQDVTASWSGKEILSSKAGASTDVGRVGIATAGPGLMTFDEFLIESPE